MQQRYYLKLNANLAVFDQFSVRRFNLEEKLDDYYVLQLEATHIAPDLPLGDFIHQRVTFEMTPDIDWTESMPISRQELDNSENQHWHGVIQSMEQVASSADETCYRFTIVPRLALLNRITTTRLFQNETALSIVEKILRHHGFASEDFRLKSNRSLPRYEHRMQYRETDYAFIKRVLAREGLWFAFTQTAANEVFTVADDVSQYIQLRQQALPFKPDAGLESAQDGIEGKLQAQLSFDIAATAQGIKDNLKQQLMQGLAAKYSVSEFHVRYKAQYESVQVKDYNYRDANNSLVGKAGFNEQQPAAFGQPYIYGFFHHKDAEQAQQYARILHEHSISRHILATGKSNVQGFAPGFTMGFATEARVGAIRQWMLVSVSHSGARDEDYFNTFTAIPADCQWRPEPIKHPIIDGTVPGTICDAGQGPYAWVDEMGRYIVKLNLDMDSWQPGGESRPIRLAKPYAGGQYGQHFPLHVGTEVQLAFQNGDPDRPYIVGVLHTSSAPDHIPNTWRTRNVIRTWANNKIRMEDLNGHEHIKMATEYHKTQLNLGHLVDSGREKRGEGFELRTDGWGALRSAQALYLTTESQTAASGMQLDRKVANDEVEGALNQANHLVDVTAKHTNLKPNLDSLSELVEGCSNLKKPVILTSAVAGLAQVSPKSILNSVGEDIHQQAGKDVFTGAGENITQTAVKSVQVLAQTEDLNLIAGKKTARLASHGDAVEITAAKKISVQSVGNEILVNAKSGIKLASGGAYIEIKGGKISLYSPGPIEYKGNHQFQGPQGGNFPLPELPASVCRECLRKARAQGVGIVER
ncbi:MAG: type VI secretion system tip protein VgrG [Snodgrassella sp.]|uniref:type VI secretion system Vgr family protein n=1 Tax=Snodgrassella sp. TaxID=2815304 RepID=UPI00258309AE|nr:type VI secretion system Vgr family protein [Snodgrassella sp.]MCO6514522.1 type VI secretion system tip protein VgrG [Snodgrassella sp.]